jgi:hypothetical protein
MAVAVSNSPHRRPQSNKISPLPEKKKRTITSAAISENYLKIRV